MPTIPSKNNIQQETVQVTPPRSEDKITTLCSTILKKEEQKALDYLESFAIFDSINKPINCSSAKNNEFSFSGITALALSAFFGQQKLFLKLLMKGANIYVFDNFGQSVLHHAINGHSTALIDNIIYLQPSLFTLPDNQGNRPIDLLNKNSPSPTLFYSHTPAQSINKGSSPTPELPVIEKAKILLSKLV